MTTTIKQLLAMPIGQGTGGYTLTVKTYKKNWQVEKIWWSQVILMDETGEIPADVKVGGKFNPLRGRTNKINVIVAEIQNAEYLGKDRKKLVVDQFSIPTTMMDEYYEEIDKVYEGEIKIVRSKIKCLLASAKTGQEGSTIFDVKKFIESKELDQIVDVIIGE